jgi:hypothetical protein
MLLENGDCGVEVRKFWKNCGTEGGEVVPGKGRRVLGLKSNENGFAVVTTGLPFFFFFPLPLALKLDLT